MLGYLIFLSPEFVEKLYGGISTFLPLYKYVNLKDKFYKFRNVLREDKLDEIFKMSGSYADKKKIDKIFNKEYSGNLITNFRSRKPEGLDNFSYMQMIDFKTYMVDDILTKVDRATMQNSLEGREPFLDNELIQYIARVPIRMKFKNGTSKWILKKILYKYIPKELLDRPKMGFGIPLYKWMRENILSKYSDIFEYNFLKSQGIFNSTVLPDLVKDFVNGKSINAHFIWFIFVFQRWYKRWILNQ